METEENTLNNGFITLHRKIFEWEWYTDINTFKLFIHCLLKANFKQKKWRGQIIERGQFITSLENLSVETGLTIRGVRTALKHLEMTNEVTNLSTNHNRLITVLKYDQYQQLMTKQRQSGDKAVTTTNNDNNDNNNKATTTKENFFKKNSDFKFYGEYQNVGLTEKQYKDLECMILNSKKLNQYIEEISEKIAEKNENSKPFDYEFPNMHYIRIKKYWMWDKGNKRNQNQSTKKTNFDEEPINYEELSTND